MVQMYIKHLKIYRSVIILIGILGNAAGDAALSFTPLTAMVFINWDITLLQD